MSGLNSPRGLNLLAPTDAVASGLPSAAGDLDGVAFAVTISQPWASITVEGPRRYHSLPFRPPTLPLGKRIAIYAAAKPDLESADQAIRLLDSLGVTKAERLAWGTRTVRGAIIGVATFAGVVAQSDDPWFVGPYALWLTGAKAIKPVAMEARPGALWRLQ